MNATKKRFTVMSIPVESEAGEDLTSWFVFDREEWRSVGGRAGRGPDGRRAAARLCREMNETTTNAAKTDSKKIDAQRKDRQQKLRREIGRLDAATAQGLRDAYNKAMEGLANLVRLTEVADLEATDTIEGGQLLREHFRAVHALSEMQGSDLGAIL